MSTTQDYQAAEQLLRRPARPGELVIGDKVRPQWIDGEARFWYAVSNGVGRRFVLVDQASGTREPAFDHARLGAALASISGQQVDLGAMPFMAIELAGNAVEFDASASIGAAAWTATSASGPSSRRRATRWRCHHPTRRSRCRARDTICGRARCPAAARGL
jgi:hypothetical protein